MKKREFDMNKIIIPPILEYPQVRLEYMRRQRLGAYWAKQTLAGQFWRLYHHDVRGAGIFLNSRRIELEPEKIYLLSPSCGLRTWCEGEPIQLYIHFEATQTVCSPDYPFNAVAVDSVLRELLSAVYGELESDPDCSGSKVKLAGISLAALAMSKLPDGVFLKYDSDRGIEDACAYLRGHITGTVNVNELARRAKMSENSFLRHFRRTTGSSPYQYLMHLRYSRAAQLLESTDLPIDEICGIVGVNDRFHFSRTFKRFFGTPPARYREARTKT